MTAAPENRFYREAGDRDEFTQLCDLLPADTNWGDPITPDMVRQIVSASQPKATGDAIARSKRILALVDAYEYQPIKKNRDALRHALLDEFMPASQPKPLTDDLLVQLFYAAQGDITQFRIKAREILEASK